MEAKGKIVNTMPLVRRETSKGFCKYQYISLGRKEVQTGHWKDQLLQDEQGGHLGFP